MYLGCYIDASNRDLNGYMFDDNKMRKEICLDKCSNLGFKYFGLQATLVYMYIQRILDKTDLSGVGKSESELNTVTRT